jgi:hypothetical protein
LCAPERECVYAHQVRKFERLEEELLHLEDHREQIELEQERIVEEEISPAEAARASRTPDC